MRAFLNVSEVRVASYHTRHSAIQRKSHVSIYAIEVCFTHAQRAPLAAEWLERMSVRSCIVDCLCPLYLYCVYGDIPFIIQTMLIMIITIIFYSGFSWLLESPGNFFCKICRTWKVTENDFGPGNFSWKSSNLLGCRCNDADKDVKILSWFALGDKTFFFATCDSDEHCSMDATVTLLYVE